MKRHLFVALALLLGACPQSEKGCGYAARLGTSYGHESHKSRGQQAPMPRAYGDGSTHGEAGGPAPVPTSTEQKVPEVDAVVPEDSQAPEDQIPDEQHCDQDAGAPRCNAHAHYDAKTQACVCDDGYVDIDGACIEDCATTPDDCNDGNACTTDTWNVTKGACEHTTINCDDQNACTTDSCDTASGCEFTLVSCVDNDPCTVDYCDESGCAHEPVVCDEPGNTCNPTSGKCEFMACTAPFKTWTVISQPANTANMQVPGTFTPETCCQQCFNTPGCTYWFQFNQDSACYINVQSGATSENECPFGEQIISYADGLPAWSPGPCGAINEVN